MFKLANRNAIVMVDDNEGDRFFVEQCVIAAGLENPWLSFASGADFLRHLAAVKAGDAAMPALVLLDINMPGMNGLEVLDATRLDSAFDDLPIFCILTSSTDPRDREHAKQRGAAGFYTKAGTIDEYVAFFGAMLP